MGDWSERYGVTDEEDEQETPPQATQPQAEEPIARGGGWSERYDVADGPGLTTPLPEETTSFGEDVAEQAVDALGQLYAGPMSVITNLNGAFWNALWHASPEGTWTEQIAESGLRGINMWNEYIPDPKTASGRLTRDTTELLTAALPISKMAEALRVPEVLTSMFKTFGWSAPAATTTANAAVAEMSMVAGSQLLFDPYEARLSTWLAEVPDLGPVVREFLVSEPDDTEIEARLKMAAEDAGLGLLLLPLGALLKSIRNGARIANRTLQGMPEIPSVRDTGKFWTSDTHDRFLREMADPEVSNWGGAGAGADMVYQRASLFIQNQFGRNGPQTPGDYARMEGIINTAADMYRDALIQGGRFAGADEAQNIGAAVTQLRNLIRNEWRDVPGVDTLRGQNLLDDIRTERRGVRESFMDTVRWIEEQFARMTYDNSAGVVARIADNTPAGQWALDNFRALSGAPGAADMYFTRARNNIYRPLSSEGSTDINSMVRSHPLVPAGTMSRTDMENLDLILTLRRQQDIAALRTDFEFSPSRLADEVGGTPPAALRGAEAEEAAAGGLAQLRSELGEERFEQLLERSNAHLAAQRQQLAQLRDAGLLSEDQFLLAATNRMTPAEVIAMIDRPNPNMSGTTSGLGPLSEQSKAILNNDGVAYLSQLISRSQGAIFRNRANRALHDWLQANPNNGWLHQAAEDAPRGRSVTPISFREDGVAHTFYIDDTLARQWNESALESSTTVMQAIQYLTGAPITKLTATGANPEFSLVAFPRDLLYTWMNSGQYSPILPVAIYQQARNFLTVLKDTVTRTGRYEEYVKEGGITTIMGNYDRFTRNPVRTGVTSTQGPISRVASSIGEKWHQIRGMLSFLTDSGEVAVRLMTREQAIRNGMTPFEATARAVDYLNYRQGGWLVKHIDAALPYTNAAVQGIRGIIRTAADRPADFMLMTGQFVGGTAAIWYHNNLYHQDAIQAIDDGERARYQIIPTGLTRQDEAGNVLHGYVRIPIDHSVIPLQGMTNAWLDYSINGKQPTPEFLAELAKNYSILSEQTMLPPTLDALTTYFFNVDTYTGGAVWSGRAVPNDMEVHTYGSGRQPTSQVMIDIGSLFGLSPARLDAATDSVVARNLYLDLAGNAYNAIRGEPDNLSAMDEVSDTLLSEYPFMRKYMHWSYPREFYDSLDQFTRYEGGEAQRWNNDINAMITQAVEQLGNQPVTEDFMRDFLARGSQAEQYIRTQIPLLEQERTYDRIFRELRIRETVDRYASMPGERRETYGPNVTSTNWWRRMQWADAEARARIVYNELRATDPVRREQFMNDVVTIFGASDGFAIRLNQLIERDGNTYDGWIEGAYDMGVTQEE